MLALRGAHSLAGRHYDVLATWQDYAGDVRGRALPCDHYVPEEQPEQTADALSAFFAGA
ncbi:haloacetate dehalogenase [Saccharopolyspora kobensis]|uniref:Haloacetate dehalogenase n=1 Tax=Saccharopolyspora kobensis TaxID=146035 RepID=A0A1H5ZI39_9PSEU|nr:hypothetical protein [Saccharopolyspora kobensis]SEG35307.1 haloacetate dehalogenase [Saccharopolyspora kobensis]SFF18089.1 haloacetate dehalogenase [Saccharopolyspora kobensis]